MADQPVYNEANNEVDDRIVDTTARLPCSSFPKGGIEGGFPCSNELRDPSVDFTAGLPTLSLPKSKTPQERSESGGNIEKGFGPILVI